MGKIKTEIDLSGIPRKGKTNKINWKECKNIFVNGIYDEMRYTFLIIGLNEKTKKVKINYKDKEFEIKTDHLVKGYVGTILGKRTKNFKIEIGTRFQDEKRDITITDSKKDGKWKYYKYKCNRCKFDCGEYYSIKDKEYKKDYWITEGELIRGSGCSCCCFSPKIAVENINSIYKTNPWMIPYIGEECAKTHVPNSFDKVYPVCPDCGKIKEKEMSINGIYSNHSIGCTCSDGIKYPNKFSYELLNQLNEIYKFDYLEHEYSPEWIGLKRYDNYFVYQGKEYILEMDGVFHSNDNKMNGQTVNESKVIDNYKDEMAKEHEIEVIRIDCDYDSIEKRFEYIKQNIIENNKLKILFDLNKIDFNKCNEYACSNLIKKACNLKNENPQLTTMDIGLLMGGINTTSISKWLKCGNDYNWCTYDVNNERKLGNNKTIKYIIKNSTIPLICIETKDIYISASELERKSESIFNIKLLQSSIFFVCSGKRKQHKGFTFKYLKNLTEQEWIKYDIENKLKKLELLYDISDSFLLKRIKQERNDINERSKSNL